MSPTQSLEVIGFSKETTPGTFVAPTKFVPGTAAINDTNTVTQPVQSRGSRSQVIDVVTAHAVAVQINCELIPEVISQLIAGWFGTGGDAVSGSGTVGYTHALTPQSALPSFSIEVDSDIYTQVLARKTVGNMVDQWTMTYQAGAITTAQFTTVGLREESAATPGLPSNPTPSITTLQPMDFSLLASTFNGVATTQLVSATLTAANQCQPVRSSNGSLAAARIQPTQRKITFSTTLDFLDSSFFIRWASASATPNYSASVAPFVLTLTSAGDIPSTTNPYQVQVTLPNLRAQDAYTLNSASDVLQQQLAWSVTQGTQSNEINASIVNSESGALV